MISFDFQNGICAWNRDNVPNCLMHLTTQPPTTVTTTLETTITGTAVNECPALLGQENYECTHKTFTHNVVCKMKCPGQIFRKVCKCTDSGCDWNRLTVRVSNNKKEIIFGKDFLSSIKFSLRFFTHFQSPLVLIQALLKQFRQSKFVLISRATKTGAVLIIFT